MIHLARPVLITLLTIPILLGLLTSALPAFGYFPVLGGETLTLAYWRELLSAPGILRSTLTALIAGLITPLVSLTLVLTFLATISESRIDRWVRRLLPPVLALPHAAAAFGLAFLIAPSGFVSRLLAPLFDWQRAPDILLVNDNWGVAMMLGLVVKETPFLLLMAFAALPQLQVPDRLRMARSLGYSPAVAWLKVVAPLLYPLIRLPLFAVIAFASATVDVALILGPTIPPTLSVRLLEWFGDPDLTRRFLAAAAALLQLGVSLLAIGLWVLGEKLAGGLFRIWLEDGSRAGGERVIRLCGRGGVSLALAIATAGLFLLLLNSVAGLWRFPTVLPVDWTLRDWSQALAGVGPALRNTLIIALSASGLSMLLVLADLEAGHRARAADRPATWLIYIPLLLPQVVFLFGIIMLAEALSWQPGLLLVSFGHLLFVLPYHYLSLTEAYRRLDPRWTRLAASLGASPNRSFWRVRLPMLLAPVLSAGALGLAISISLYLPSQLLGAGRVVTLTTEAVALAAGGSASTIAVWAVMQAALPMLAFAIALSLPRLIWRHRSALRDLHAA